MATGAPVIEQHPGFIEEIGSDELELKEPVGKGSFGVVYMAIWRGIHVAVKKIESEAERISFMTELRQLSRVSHPNIVCLYGACRNPVSLVMEFAECGSLYSLLHGPGPQPHYTSGHGMSWCLQCATGVAYLHGMKPKALIHRDLKPPNLLLTNNGVVLKICDFGTACDQHTHMTNNKGSAAWMAPEVFEGCQYSEKCDVFSWGIILWEVLTRKKPFDDLGGPAFRIMWAVHTGARPNLIQGCPKSVEQLMTSCWSAKPHERPSMNEVEDAMNDLMTFFPGGSTPLSFPSHDYESNSEASSGYELSMADSIKDSHMGTISDTIRKPSVKPAHPSGPSLGKARIGSNSPSVSLQRPKDLSLDSKLVSRPQSHNTPRTPSDPFDMGKKGSPADSAFVDFEPSTMHRNPERPHSSTPTATKSIRHLGKNSPMIDPAPAVPSPAPEGHILSSYVPPVQPTPISIERISSDQEIQHNSLPLAYLTLELHLQPLPPSTSSKKSMEIYQQHCLLAEEYLRVSTAISVLKQRVKHLKRELEQDEKAQLEGNMLKQEYQQLVEDNTSLQKWYDQMKKDLARVREHRQNKVWS